MGLQSLNKKLLLMVREPSLAPENGGSRTATRQNMHVNTAPQNCAFPSLLFACVGLALQPSKDALLLKGVARWVVGEFQRRFIPLNIPFWFLLFYS